jgi:hypothetical protein
MNNACPGCGAVYAVAEKDIGRRIACKKCSASLIVAEDGLRYDENAAAPPPKKEDAPERDRGRNRDRDRDDDDRPGRKKREREREREETPEEIAEREARRARRAAATADIMNKIKGVGDVATWLYAIGLVLTIYANYAGQIDIARVAGREGNIKEEERDMIIEKRKIQAEIEERKPPDATSDEEKKIKEIDKDWKKRKNVLDDKLTYAQTSQQQGQWWNVVYKLLGFILLGFGAIGYLKPEQGPYKRILGGVTIALILAQVVGGFPLFPNR